MQKTISFNDLAIAYVKGSDYRIYFWYRDMILNRAKDQQGRDKYKNSSEEEIEQGRNRYDNMSEEKKERLKEYKKNYREAKKLK